MFYSLFKIFVSLIFKLFYPLKVTGLDNLPQEGAMILVANHSNYFDPLYLGVVIPRKINWMVLRPFYDLWWLKWLFKATSCFPVNIDKPNIGTIKRALMILKQGKVLGIFPEGGRSKDGELKEGKLGVALLALISGAPVLPAAIEGAFEAYPPGAILPKPRIINVNFGKILTFDRIDKGRIDGKTLRMITKQIMKSIERLIGDLKRGGRG